MFSLPIQDLLARAIFTESQPFKHGEQNVVLWVVVNRLFTDKNFTYGNPQTLYNVLYYGGWESLTANGPAYSPPTETSSEAQIAGWNNAKRLAATLVAIIKSTAQNVEADTDTKNIEKSNLNEDLVRRLLSSQFDSEGNFITNPIGTRDSFLGYNSNREGDLQINGGNHFYWY